MKSFLMLIACALIVSPGFARQDAQPKAPQGKQKREKKADETPPAAEKEALLKQKALAGKAVAEREVKAAIQRGIALLVDLQEDHDKQGGIANEWPYEGVVRDREGNIPIGYRVGGTAITGLALIEASVGAPKKDVLAALVRGLEFVIWAEGHEQFGPTFVTNYDTRGWGHAYGLAFLLAMREHELVPETSVDRVNQAIRWHITALETTAMKVSGGWNYSRSNSNSKKTDEAGNALPPSYDAANASPFMTAPTLQFLFEAARLGETVDPQVIEAALKTLEEARLEGGSYEYATSPKETSDSPINRVQGSTGRSPVCEVTLMLAGRGDLGRLRQSVSDFFAHWEWLEQRRKQPGTHTGAYAIAPYFFYYAHRHVAQAIEFLPEAERPEWRAQLTKLLWAVREKSGGWNDRVFERSTNFGTAMTILSLLEPARARPAEWKVAPKTDVK